jgi:hypothetical protein
MQVKRAGVASNAAQPYLSPQAVLAADGDHSGNAKITGFNFR